LAARIAYDVCFFVVIIVLLLNIIFGIIIDTFGQLREESSEKQELMASFCFICGISKDVFDSRASNGAMGGVGGLNFAGHIESEHNMWDYMLFLLYLQEKNPNDYNGIERSVLTSLRLDPHNSLLQLCGEVVRRGGHLLGPQGGRQRDQ
jgi:hypothetical protein